MNVEPESRSFRLWPWLAVYAAVAIWLTFSNLLQLHSADSLIYSLGSLDHWTPFFWEQDRVGMLIPLMTMPFRNPLTNLLAQTFLTTFAGLILPLLLMRLLNPTPAGALAAALCNLWFMIAAPDLLHENQFIVCMYPTGLGLGIAALIVAESLRSRFNLLLSLVLMILGMWTYLGIVVVLLPLALLRWRLSGQRFDSVIVTVIAFAVGFALMTFAGNVPPFAEPATNATLPWRQWPSHWAMFPFRIREQAGGELWLMVIIGAFVIGEIISAVAARKISPPWWPVMLLVTVAIIEVGFLGTRRWVADNLHHPRYIVFTTTAIPLTATLLLANVLIRVPRLRFGLVLMLLMLAAAQSRYGSPFTTNPRVILNERFGRYSDSILNSDCLAMGADYWNLWTTYYHIRMTQYDSGGPVPIPVGWRSWEYRQQWFNAAKVGPFRIAVPRNRGFDAELIVEATRRGLEPPAKIGETPVLTIYTTRPERK